MKDKSVLLKTYLGLEEIREKFAKDQNEALEDALLDLMDDVWYGLSKEEINWLNSRE